MNTVEKLEIKLQAAIDEREKLSHLAGAKERLDINLAYIDKLVDIGLETTIEITTTTDQVERTELVMLQAHCMGRVKGTLDTCRIINDVLMK